jgi:DNA ligase D-like protein (predicted 3'-phosphoesterase)
MPKGRSPDPRDRRLAVRTKDHPLDYVDFEGTIDEDQYGAGTVVVWDTGTYRSLTEYDGERVPIARAVEAGHLVVRLDGLDIAEDRHA